MHFVLIRRDEPHVSQEDIETGCISIGKLENDICNPQSSEKKNFEDNLPIIKNDNNIDSKSPIPVKNNNAEKTIIC